MEIIDFTDKNKLLTESWLASFGGIVKSILGRMLGDSTPFPFKVKGSKREVESFLNSLKGEYKYIKSIRKNGLNSAATFKNKAKLQRAVRNFEKETGLMWPFE